MNSSFSKFFNDNNLPYVELRYSNSNKHYKEHLHDTFSIGVNTKGESIYTNKEKSFEFKPDMIAVINPNTVHSCNSTQKTENEYYMMYLDINWCFELQKSIDKNIKEFKPFSKEIMKNKEKYYQFIKLCELLFSDEFYMNKECEIIEFFKELFSKDLKNSNKTEKIDDKKIQDILKYLKENYSSNISLKELEEQFKLNSFYIIRLFNEKIGLSPHQYLLNLKINKSKELLKSGYSIVDTALECGFSDQSHFHRNFVNIVATTPRKYQLNFIQ